MNHRYLIEDESNIRKYKDALGLSWNQLLRKIGYNKTKNFNVIESYQLIKNLNSGIETPMNPQNGKPKKMVLALIEFFKVPFEELFPRYACEFENSHPTKNELLNLISSEYSHFMTSDPEDICYMFELCDKIQQFMITDTDVKRDIIMKELINTCDENNRTDIANINNMSRERVRQILNYFKTSFFSKF